MAVSVQSLEQGFVLCVDVALECLHREEPHLGLVVVILKLSTDHDVHGFEQELAEIVVDLLAVVRLLELLELLGVLAHDECALLSREINVDRI